MAQTRYCLALIPDELCGRVNGAFRLIAFTCETASLALTGFLLQQVGVTATVAIFGVALIGLALAATLNRGLRQARLLAEL